MEIRKKTENILPAIPKAPKETKPERPLPPIHEVDLSECWDMESQQERFFEEIRKLPFYRPGLVYSGFNAKDIGKSWGAKQEKEENIIYGETEEIIKNPKEKKPSDLSFQNPLEFALEYKNPAIAVYDPDKLQKDEINPFPAYKIQDPSALLAIVRLKL